MSEAVGTALRAELQTVYLFSALNPPQFDEALADARCLTLDKSQQLFEQGAPARHFYYVRRGLIKLYRLSPEGEEKIIELVGPSESFAEALMFAEGEAVYPVSAQALEVTELVALNSRHYRDVLRGSVDTCFRVMGKLSRRLRALIEEIDRLSLHNATYRLVTYLLQQLPPGVPTAPNVQLTTAKTVIASRLSIKPETFSRILARLTQRGLIEVHDTNIVLRDIAALERLVAAEE
ncbi:MAG: hypothetical protein AMS22_00245 [Thiotrichales bacterium SG8_50]|nr:MAG: hypothetical protein AMS22_00245 [Thiotrichales bacterium SG8_50]